MQFFRYFAAALLCAMLLPGSAMSADKYPSRPITIVVPFSAGGASDLTARFVAKKLSQRIGVSVIVDNKAGASGTIGAQYVARSAPDGYTLMLVDTSFSQVTAIGMKMPYDPVKDFTPIRLIVTVPAVVCVNTKVPAHTLKDLLNLARQSPGRITYASGGVGSPLHMAAALLAIDSGTQMLHVPYKGAAPAITDTIGGQTQVVIPALAAVLPMLKAGKLRALAVTTLHRSAQLPDVPTVAEAGVPGYEATSWFGLTMPAGAPKQVVQRLRDELGAILAEPDAAAFFGKLGANVAVHQDVPFPVFVKQQIGKWTDVAHKANIHVK